MSMADPRQEDSLETVWQRALQAAALFAVDPAGLRGIAVRAHAGPVRERWLATLRALLPESVPVRRLPAGIEDDRLLGGLDLTATLKSGRPVLQSGILAEADGGIVIIPMAERLRGDTAGRLMQALDLGEVAIAREGIDKRIPAQLGLVALDESEPGEDGPPPALTGRMAFWLDLDSLPRRAAETEAPFEGETIAAARQRHGAVQPATDEQLEAIIGTAAALGIASLQAPILALQTARAAAALGGRKAIAEADIALAAQLVLAPRATQMPAPPEPAPEEAEDESAPEPEDAPEEGAEPEAPPEGGDDPESESPSEQDLNDLILEAVQTALPKGLLDAEQKAALSGPASERRGSGKNAAPAQRGRPMGERSGSLRGGDRLALVSTLRAAAPWQPLRHSGQTTDSRRVEVRPEDLRIRKFAKRREMTTIFCVDASGSTAFQRLAEAKGAVELLLSEAYVERTHGALIAFRGSEAELLLPPTRSLARAKALLANLPGGGGTPLAAGLEMAAQIADAERRKGHDPLIVLLTDGRGNIARDGTAGRDAAMADATEMAKMLRTAQIPGVMVDTSPRARPDGRQLAEAMGARYVALPRAEAAAVRDVVKQATA